MNLIELYDSLDIPEGNKKVFNSIVVPEYSDFRIAIDVEGNPVLLLSIRDRLKDSSFKNFRFKYLQLEQNVECSVSGNESPHLEVFTVITFRSEDKSFQEYFLRVSETLIRTIGQNSTSLKVVDSLKKFVDVFSVLTDVPKKTIQGLWAELFLIESSKNPSVLLNYWHHIPNEKFDFNAGIERVEVKSSSTFERKHFFTSDQLNSPIDTQILIASVFIRQSNTGKNIQHLLDSIIEKVGNNIELVDKLNVIVCNTLGNSLEHSFGLKIDYDIAKQSLQFYRHQDIDKIEEVNIPDNVSEVRYSSDLSSVAAVNLADFNFSNILFGAL